MSFQLVSVQLLFVPIPLRFSVEHALAARSENTTGLLVLTAQDGTQGVGEFLAREYVMGETRAEIAAQLKQLAQVVLRAPMDDPIQFLGKLWQQEHVPGQFGAIGALDLALLDLASKKRGVSLPTLLEPRFRARNHTPNFSAVYPFATGLKRAALNFIYRRVFSMQDVKMKGSGEIERDLNYVSKIRNAFSYPIRIRVDLNASLVPENAKIYFEQMLKANIHWFEQPFAKNDFDTSAHFQRLFENDAVLCADESVCTRADLEQIIASQAFRAVNLRIGKNGGLLKSLELYQRAMDAGLKVQLGALVGETSVLGYAGLHFAALTAPLEHYEGAFGKFLLKWDPVHPSLTFGRHGRVPFTRLPMVGLVPAFDLRRAQQKAISHEIWSKP